MAYRRTPLIQERIDSQRRAILDAAAQLLAESGFTGCSVAAVATRAGLATGTVYRHFDSKADLAAEVFRTLVGREVRAVRTAASAGGSSSDRVRAVLETFARRALKSPVLAFALLVEPVDATVDEQRLEFRRQFRDVLAELIAAGIADGSYPPQDTLVSAAALVGATAEALVGPLAAGSQQPDSLDALLDFAHRALGTTVLGPFTGGLHASNP